MIYVGFAFVILILICIIIFSKRSARRENQKVKPIDSRGEVGENIVANILGETVAGQQYVINDLLFMDKSGHSRQIDHVYINKFGIWVIETKNYSGQIYGNETQREWTQVLSYGKEKHNFYNPVKQNLTHIYRLSDHLKVKGIFHNVIVFLYRADISNVSAPNVYSVGNLQLIKSQDTGILLSVQKMEYYYNQLLDLKRNCQVSKEEHISNIHQMQYDIQNGICPRCGARLVLRNGKNGQFYGCYNFPKCKFTKNFE